MIPVTEAALASNRSWAPSYRALVLHRGNRAYREWMAETLRCVTDGRRCPDKPPYAVGPANKPRLVEFTRDGRVAPDWTW